MCSLILRIILAAKGQKKNCDVFISFSMKKLPTQALFYSGDWLYLAVFSIPLTPKGDINDGARRSQQSIIWISLSLDIICISKTQRVLYWKLHVWVCITYWYFGVLWACFRGVVAAGTCLLARPGYYLSVSLCMIHNEVQKKESFWALCHQSPHKDRCTNVCVKQNRR